jgi:hypothetical protein
MNHIKVIVGLTTNIIPEICQLIAEYYSDDLDWEKETRFSRYKYQLWEKKILCGICLSTDTDEPIRTCGICFLNLCDMCAFECGICGCYLCNYCSVYFDEEGCSFCDIIYEKMNYKYKNKTFLSIYVKKYLIYIKEISETPIKKYMEKVDPNIEYKI